MTTTKNGKKTTSELQIATENYMNLSPQEIELLQKHFKGDDIDLNKIKEEDFKQWKKDLEQWDIYKKMWEYWGTLFETNDVYAVKNYMEEIGKVADREKKQEKTGMTKMVQDWIRTTSGWWTTTRIYNELHLTTKGEKKGAYQAILRELEKEVIERHPKEQGKFRRVERELTKLEWRNAPTEPLPFTFGLNLDEFFCCYQKNLIVICSHPDGGKTAYLLRWLAANQKKIQRVYGRQALYLVNDMGEQEFRKRVSLHEDMKEDDWDLDEVYERDSNFEDVVLSDGVTIIDFIQEDEPFKVGQTFKRIHQKLKTGICIAALQKPFDRDLGYGKEYSMHYPRLYMIFDTKRDKDGLYGMAKILKCKNRKTEESLTGKSLKFKLIKGWKFKPEGIWYYAGDDPYDKELEKARGK